MKINIIIGSLNYTTHTKYISPHSRPRTRAGLEIMAGQQQAFSQDLKRESPKFYKAQLCPHGRALGACKVFFYSYECKGI